MIIRAFKSGKPNMGERGLGRPWTDGKQRKHEVPADGTSVWRTKEPEIVTFTLGDEIKRGYK